MNELRPELSKVFHEAVESAARRIHDEVMSLRLAPRNSESQSVARTEWDGEGGIPPVGEVCEVTTNDGHNWREVLVLFSDEYVLLVKSTDGLSGYQLLHWSDSDVSFRAVQTPERIAQSAREKAIDEMCSGVSIVDQVYGFRELAEKLYDAGYRKT